MRIQIIFSIIIILGLQSCFHKEYENKLENKLEKKFSKRIFRKDNVKKITMHYDNIFEIDTISYYNGYDNNNRIINEANRDFYEYDLQGRIIKKYSCFVERDPECNKPVIYNYEYTGKKDLNIKCLYRFSNDSVVNISTETFQYDNIGRLIEHTKYPSDTMKYTYLGNDTSAQTELWISWVEPFTSRVKVERKTTYFYDNLGRKASLTWVQSVDNLSIA